MVVKNAIEDEVIRRKGMLHGTKLSRAASFHFLALMGTAEKMQYEYYC